MIVVIIIRCALINLVTQFKWSRSHLVLAIHLSHNFQKMYQFFVLCELRNLKFFDNLGAYLTSGLFFIHALPFLFCLCGYLFFTTINRCTYFFLILVNMCVYLFFMSINYSYRSMKSLINKKFCKHSTLMLCFALFLFLQRLRQSLSCW